MHKIVNNKLIIYLVCFALFLNKFLYPYNKNKYNPIVLVFILTSSQRCLPTDRYIVPHRTIHFFFHFLNFLIRDNRQKMMIFLQVSDVLNMDKQKKNLWIQSLPRVPSIFFLISLSLFANSQIWSILYCSSKELKNEFHI